MEFHSWYLQVFLKLVRQCRLCGVTGLESSTVCLLVSLCIGNAAVANANWWNFSLIPWQIYMPINVCAPMTIGGPYPFTVLTSHASSLFIYSQYPKAEVVNFGTWFLFSFPISLIMLVLTWFWLHWLFLGCKWVKVVQETQITNAGHLQFLSNVSNKGVLTGKWQNLRHNFLLFARTIIRGNLTSYLPCIDSSVEYCWLKCPGIADRNI